MGNHVIAALAFFWWLSQFAVWVIFLMLTTARSNGDARVTECDSRAWDLRKERIQ